MVGMDKGVLTEIEQIKKHLVLPAIAAPMFLVSGPALVIEACKAGIIGCFPTMNAKDPGLLDEWFQTISDEVAYPDKRQVGPWSANIIVHSSSKRFDSDFKLLLEYKPRLVITALGSPKRVCDKVHEYGGLVFADVSSVVFAKKAVAAGVDGLVLYPQYGLFLMAPLSWAVVLLTGQV
jgi:nitronate monooxygenase